MFPQSAELGLTRSGSYWVSPPRRLPRLGSISKLVSCSPARNWQFRLGRELVWFGNMEDEGAMMWLLNQPDERYDTAAARGRRSLRQTRLSGTDSITTNFEERLPCYDDSASNTLHARLRTQNSRDAGINLRCYSDRTGLVPLGSSNLGTEVSGTTGWTFFHKEFRPPARTAFFDVFCKSEAPMSGTGLAWFDDVGIIEWEDWTPLAGPAAVRIPNDYYWLQVRTDTETETAFVSCEETSYNPLVGVKAPPVIPSERGESRNPSLRASPSIFSSRTTITWSVPTPNPQSPASNPQFTIRLYNSAGREVRTLLAAAPHPRPTGRVIWDGLDNSGRPLAAGAYFCRLEAGNAARTVRVILLR
ncbi:hypothetical protein FJY71_09855 [candidate division WOR-3 bacterium]|nr:hypothetical protein [candidate division WOR-3 bacterium]